MFLEMLSYVGPRDEGCYIWASPVHPVQMAFCENLLQDDYSSRWWIPQGAEGGFSRSICQLTFDLRIQVSNHHRSLIV